LLINTISRFEQDQFACESHRRAITAIDAGRFDDEIVPVAVPQRKGEPVIVSQDERPRRDTNMEALGRLKPAFRSNGTVTAGNSSGMNDGAAALLITSASEPKQLGLKPLARILTSAAAGVPPRTMGIGPVPAVHKALERAGINASRTLAWWN
jgi:acetyl-CoA acetyltransferase